MVRSMLQRVEDTRMIKVVLCIQLCNMASLPSSQSSRLQDPIRNMAQQETIVQGHAYFWISSIHSECYDLKTST
eukprot:scaffold243480_cov35-Attheya_sp.AAC.1